MKKLTYLWLFFFASVCTIIAQAPQKFSYQAVIRNASDQLIKNGDVGLRISLVRGSEIGPIVYQEIFNPNPTTNINGLLTVQIGGGIPITGSFSTIDWAAGPYFIRTEADPTGGTNYTLNTSSALLSIPYALLAKNVENLPSIKLDQLSDVNSPSAQVGQVLKWNGNEWIAANDNTGGNTGPIYTAGSGISIDANHIITNTGDGDNNAQNEFQKLSLSGNELTLFPSGNSVTLPSGPGGGDNWGSQTVATNTTLTGNGTVSNPLGININSINQTHIQDQSISAADLGNMGAQNGQVLKWNGQVWAPSNDEQGNGNTGTITINSGNGINVNPTTGTNFTITNTSPGNLLNLQAGNGIAISGAWPNYQIANTTSNNSPWFVNASNRVEYNGVGAVITNNIKSSTLDSDGLSFKVSSTVLPITYTGSEIIARGPLTYTRMEAGEIKTGFNNTTTNYLSFKPEGIIKTTTLGSDEFALGFLDNFNQTTKQLIVKLNGVDVANSIKIGSASSVSPVPDGTIQFANGDFQGRMGGVWKSLTASGISGSGTTTFFPYFTSNNAVSNSNLSLNSATGRVTLNGGTNGEFVIDNESGMQCKIFVGNGGIFIGSQSDHNTVLMQGGVNKITLESDKFRPSVSNMSLGSSSNKWSVVHAVNGTIQTSDRRLKKNIKPSGFGIKDVMKLKPVTWEWINEKQAGSYMGFIAQDLLEVVPNAVYVPTKDDYKEYESAKAAGTSPEEPSFGIKYTELIPVLTKAIQEQQEMIASQKEQLDSQKKLIESLSRRLDHLEKNK